MMLKPGREIVAESIKTGFMCGVVATTADSVVFDTRVNDSLNYGIAVFAGVTAYKIVKKFFTSKYRYINERAKTDS